MIGVLVVVAFVVLQGFALIAWAEIDNRHKGIGGKWGRP